MEVALLTGPAEDRRATLAFNCGSSSLKFGLYLASADKAQLLYEGEAEEVGTPNASFWSQKSGEARQIGKEQAGLRTHAEALKHALAKLRDWDAPQAKAVGHRMVHGGPGLREHARLTEAVAQELAKAVSYAPLHMPAALSVLKAVESELPDIPQVICLDTAFHRRMPETSKTYALPQAVRALGVERYGFHGLSLESIVAQLESLPSRMIVAHLGSGSSVTAIHDGVSVDTSMGLTPTGGVMMGTRPGDLDPGVLIYLLRNGYETAEKLETLLDHKSGLLGVSGKSSDVRELSKIRKDNHLADLALEMFCYQVRKTIGSMAAALGGLDCLVFTGGIGEHAAELREEICKGLEFAGVGKNVDLKILPSQEDEQIAKVTARLCC